MRSSPVSALSLLVLVLVLATALCGCVCQPLLVTFVQLDAATLPQRLAVDSSGFLYGASSTFLVVKVSPAGTVEAVWNSTVDPARGGYVVGVAVQNGVVYVVGDAFAEEDDNLTPFPVVQFNSTLANPTPSVDWLNLPRALYRGTMIPLGPISVAPAADGELLYLLGSDWNSYVNSPLFALSSTNLTFVANLNTSSFVNGRSYSVAVGSDGSLYLGVSTTFQTSLYHLSSTGALLSTGILNARTLGLRYQIVPKILVPTSNGQLLVMDATNNIIMMMNSSGQYTHTLPTSGMMLTTMALGANDDLYVVDAYSHKIWLYVNVSGAANFTSTPLTSSSSPPSPIGAASSSLPRASSSSSSSTAGRTSPSSANSPSPAASSAPSPTASVSSSISRLLSSTVSAASSSSILPSSPLSSSSSSALERSVGSASSDLSSSSSLAAGTIAGIAIAVLFGILLVLASVLYLCHVIRRRAKASASINVTSFQKLRDEAIELGETFAADGTRNEAE